MKIGGCCERPARRASYRDKHLLSPRESIIIARQTGHSEPPFSTGLADASLQANICPIITCSLIASPSSVLAINCAYVKEAVERPVLGDAAHSRHTAFATLFLVTLNGIGS